MIQTIIAMNFPNEKIFTIAGVHAYFFPCNSAGLSAF
jgi:hypothetical protein